ncbi:MAG: peptidylprolyl isomerase [Chloroflexi bacterium]|nr:peptidylprolyl isomerase [Chloroflexota bacterium]
MAIDPNKTYRAVLKTQRGDIVVELLPKEAPATVNSFVFLARQGFYDNTTFHRVLPGFMAQGGDPTGTGRGGPGYNVPDEISDLKHETGVLSMANTGRPNTGGSQFFITYAPTPHLDGGYTIFGRVIEGMDALKRLTPRDPEQNPRFQGDALLKVEIVEQ